VLKTTRKAGPVFKVKEIWFADEPEDIKGYAAVTFLACKHAAEINGFAQSDFSTLVIDLTESLTTIWDRMDKKSCRYEIKRAERDGVRTQQSTDYQAFREIYRALGRTKKINASLDLDYLAKYTTLYMAYIQNKPVAGQVYVQDSDNIRWLYGASRRFDANVLVGCANRLLIWNTIKLAKEQGIKEFDFGGYCLDSKRPELIGVNFFKQSFGGKLVTHYHFTKEYSWLYKQAKKIKEIL
jgi:lipid II:glycine glycyltransferase (peptidoglycan interpeptide bridge formation enzyme)